MPKITDARREERRALIVEAALRRFMSHGYQRTTMADIIEESGLSAGAIYGYFPGKAELVYAVATRILSARRTELAIAGRDRALSPAAIVTLLIDGVRREAPMPVLMQVWAEATVDENLRALAETAVSEVRGAIIAALIPWAEEDRRRTGGVDPAAWARAAAPVITALVPGFVLQRTLLSDFDEQAFLRAIALVVAADVDDRPTG
jgi:TetR/AcrR family transcriptional regulator, transcriptional repressor of aconitase